MSYSSEVLADSPLAYYRHGESSGTTMVDSSGNGRNGTYTNAPTLGVTGLVAGDSDTAADYNGSSNYATTTYGAWMAVSSFTIEAIITPGVSTTDMCIAGRWSSGGSRPFFLGINASGKLRVVSSTAGAEAVGATTLSAGQTYHVAATVTGTTARVYVNGIEDGSDTSFTLATNNLPFFVARYHGSATTGYFDGVVDEVAIYGSALSGTRIAAHHAAMSVTVSGGQATETDSASAGSTTVGAVVAGGQATETDSAQAGSTAVGAVVEGSQAQETDEAQAGSVSTAEVIEGGQAEETDTAQGGATVVDTVVQGGTGTETDEALAGTVATDVTVAGGQTEETDSALAGSVVDGEPDEFTCLDLETDVTPIFDTSVAGGELVPPTDDYTYTIVSGLGELDPDTTYQIRLAFDGGSFGTSDDPESYVSLYLSQGPDEADYLAGSVYPLLSEVGPHDNPAIFTIGPGVGSWAAGHTAEHRYLFVEGPTNSNVTAICHLIPVVPPEIDEPEPVETDPELVEVAPVDQGEHEDAWHTYPTIEPGPAWQAWDVAFVLDTDGNKIEKRKDRLRDVVLVDGVDITTINGHRTHTADYQRMKPFSYGPGSIRPQGINAILDDLSSYTWLKPWARVLVLRVNDDNEIVKVDHRGYVLSIDISGTDVTLSLGGVFSGRAAVQWRPKPLIRRRENPVYWLHAMFRKNRMPLDTVDLGFDEVTSPPQGWHLNCALDVVAGAVKRNGDALTVAYDETAKKFAAALVDRETINATVYLDHGLMRAELTRDYSAEKNQVYAAGTDENGLKILFAVAPGMEQVVPAPDYPLASGDPFGEGTEDADTTDGAGISRLILRLIALGYMQRDDKSGGFDADVARAVTDARIDAKLDDYGLGDPTLEQVDEDLWAWLWDVDATGLTMKEARIRPAYEVPGLGKYNFTATGQLKGVNPDHDPDLIPVSEVVDFTTSMRKGQMKKRARRYVFDGPNWSGTITPTVTGVIAGEHNPGDPFTEADVISARDVREGWNLWVPNFEGGTLFHVSGVDVSDDGFGVRFMVDTQARDTLTINEILDRQEQNRLSPSKAFWKQASGNFGKDTITGSIGEIGGKLGTDVFCPAGQATVLPIPVGDYGLIEMVRSRLRVASETITDVFEGSSPFASNDGVKHILMLFGEDVRTNNDTRESQFIDNRRPNPFAAGDFVDVKAAMDDFKDRKLLLSLGGENEDGSFSFCGYGHFGETGGTLSGNTFDDSGFPFRAPDCVGYLVVIPEVDAWALAGRWIWWQLDEGT